MSTGGTPRRRVLALAPYPESAPSSRFRIVQLRAALAALRVDLTFHPFLGAAAYRTLVRGGALAGAAAVVEGFESIRGVIDRAADYDAVLVQRGVALLFDRRLLDALQRRGVPLIYDFDDAVYLPQERGRRWLERLRDPDGTTRAFCRAARVVLAGNEVLADFARAAVGPAGRVRVVPSVVDTDTFRPAGAARPPGPPTLGWVGSDTTVGYLEALAPALRALAGRVPHRLVVVSGARRPRLDGVAYDFRAWEAGREVADFQELDVGLYPLDDSPWSRGKCGFKALQYLSCGAPCVASPVGVLRDIVRPGVTGLHACDTDAWVEACASLLADPEARARMGDAGRKLVEERYSVRVAAPEIAAAVEEAIRVAVRPAFSTDLARRPRRETS